MTSTHVLDFGHDRIRLLRGDDETCEILGVIDTDTADLTSRLKALVSTAGVLPLTARIVLPDSQILYTRVDAPGPDDAARTAQVRTALDGRTPYPLDEIAFDWSADGHTALVAAIALETLDEARRFAEAHGIAVAGYSARPAFTDFPREAVFEHRVTDGANSDEAPAEAPGDGSGDTVDPQAPVIAPVTAPAFATRRGAESDTTSPATRLSERPARFSAASSPAPVAMEGVTAPDLPPTDPVETTPNAEPAAVVTTGAGFTADGVPDHGPAAASLRPRAYDETRSPRPAGPVKPPKARPDGTAGARRKRLAVAALIVGLVVAGGWTLVATFSPPKPGESALSLPAPIEIPDTAPDTETALAEPEATAPLLPIDSTAFTPTPEELSETETEALDQTVAAPGPGPEPFADSPREVAALVGAGADGLQRAPKAPVAPRAPADADVDIAAINPITASTDAFAMPAPAAPDRMPSAAPAPLPLAAESPDTAIIADGTESPAPPLAPPPGGVALNLDGDATDPDAGDLAPTALAEALPAEVAPRERPEDLVERTERARFGGRTLQELAGLRPRARPLSPQSDPSIDAAPTDLAVARSPMPRQRPDDMDAVVASARAALSPAPAAATAASTAGLSDAGQLPGAATTDDEPEPEITTASAPPSLPTRAEVAREATIENAIRLGQVNLIGVYGSPSDRRALIRLPSGRFVKVKVGDRVDGGQIAAIGDNSLRYVKGGRDVTLTVPSG